MSRQHGKGFVCIELGTFFVSALVGFGAALAHNDYAMFPVIGVLTYLTLSILHLAVAWAIGARKPRLWEILTNLFIMIS